VTCGSGDIAQREAEKAARESIESLVIDLTFDSDSDSNVVMSTPTPPKTAGSSKIGSRNPTQTSAGVTRNSPQSRNDPSSARQSITLRSPGHDVSSWTCEVCTLINDTHALQCAACMANPPRDSASGWICLHCGAGNETGFWMCRLCTVIKSDS